MSRVKSSITYVVALFLFSWVSITRADASEKSAARWVEEIKQIVRSEGEFAELSLSNQRSFAGRRIGYLDQIKSPEGVAGLIEIITDPGFIEFDRQFSHDRDGNYVKRQVMDPLVGPMVKTCWYLYTQPLVDEAAIPSIATDRSREWRHHALYGHKVEELVADCSAWCREVQAGRMSFQMKGDPTRYGRYGKSASNSRSVGRDHRNERQKNEENQIKEDEKKTSLTWVYLLLGALIAVTAGVAIKQKTRKA